MEKKELQKIIEEHQLWALNKKGGVRANLSGAKLYNANLRYADLRNANLSGANLRYADLRNANLSGADLSAANLSGADLSGADLRGADLSGADLGDANLSYADLRGADLSGADLSGANLGDTKILQVGPIGSRRDYTVYNVSADIVQCGCWRDYKGGSLDEFEKRVAETYETGAFREEYDRAIAYFKAEREAWEARHEGKADD